MEEYCKDLNNAIDRLAPSVNTSYVTVIHEMSRQMTPIFCCVKIFDLSLSSVTYIYIYIYIYII